MSKTYKAKGIIIRRFNVGEADRLLDVYTPNLGRIRVKAKSVRRPQSKLGGHLEIFSEVDFVIAKGRAVAGIVTGARCLQDFSQIKDDLTKTSIAYYFCELIFWLTQEEYKDTKLYDHLYQALWILDQGNFSQDFIKDLFLSNVEMIFLARLGYKPELFKSSMSNQNLRKESKYFFSLVDGGVILGSEKKESCYSVSSDEIKILRLLVIDLVEPSRWQKIPSALAKNVHKIVRAFVHYTLERNLKTENFVKLVDRMHKFD